MTNLGTAKWAYITQRDFPIQLNITSCPAIDMLECSIMYQSHIVLVIDIPSPFPWSYGDHHVLCIHVELWYESCFYLMYVFESTTACCEAGEEDVIMTTVANDLQVTTA